MNMRTDGGPAFPCARDGFEGMSLRDYFAAQALSALISETFLAGLETPGSDACRTAYNYADLMLETRKR